MIGRGPRISIATRSNGPKGRSACIASLGFVGGALRVAQLSYAAHHLFMSVALLPCTVARYRSRYKADDVEHRAVGIEHRAVTKLT